MPYKGASDPKLPEYVKKLGEGDRAQWSAVWNSAYKKCHDEGGEDCESSAFAQANGVVMKKDEGMAERIGRAIMELFKRFSAIENDLTPSTAKDRAVCLSDALEEAVDALEGSDETGYPWVVDAYLEGETVFLVVAKGGKLYRVNVMTDGDEVMIGDWVPLEPSQATESRMIVSRAGNIARWFLLAGTSVLNRNGQIDSAELYDDMIRRAESGEKPYPYLTFSHLKETFRMGQADWLGRDGVVYLASGTFDQDNPIADATIRAWEANPDKWGASIAFYPMSEPDYVDIADGVSVPVYRTGWNEEISVLPEKLACAWFTGLSVDDPKQERSNMDKKIEEALLLLAGGNQELLAQLREKVNGVNRAVVEGNLVHREAAVEVAAEAQPVAEVPAPVEPEVREVQIVLDDAAMPALIQALENSQAWKDLVSRVKSLQDAQRVNAERLDGVQEDVTRQTVALHSRLKVLESDKAQVAAERKADTPRAVSTRMNVTYRPSQGANAQPAPRQSGLGDIAEATLNELGI